MGSVDSDIVRRAEAILASAKSYNGERNKRYELMQQVDLLYQELEDPMDGMLRQWTFMNTSCALDTLAKVGAFEKMPKSGDITARELGALTKTEPGVIVRLMRMLTGTGIVALTGEDTYAHTPKSLAYLPEAALDFFNLCCNMMTCYLSFPTYFRTKSPEDLIDLRKTPYSCAYDSEGLMFYEVLTADPARLQMFNKAMMQQEAALPILGMFPFGSLKQEVEAEPDRAFIVDIGGGRGQCLLEIQKEITEFKVKPRMVLQDRLPVLDSIPAELVPGIEKMAYDFYTEQPVKNAHIYYLRRILHNYQDGICLAILKVISDAMGPTSRLLIAEFVVPTQTTVGEDMSPYWMDMVMLAIGGKERNKKEFEALFEKTNLELVKIWPIEMGTQAVIEARLRRT